MRYTILKNIRCSSIRHFNYGGTFEYTDMESLSDNLIDLTIWNKEITKDDLPLISMTTFKDRIRSDDANPSNLFALDFDDAGNDIDTVIKILGDSSYLLYTTSSHTQEHHKFRVMLKLDTYINNNEESHAAFKIISDRFAIFGMTLDTACKDISRRFFLPAYDKQGEIPTILCQDGNDYIIKDELEKSIKNIELEKHLREIERIKNQVMRKGNKPKIGVDKKIADAQDSFLSNPGHQQLGRLIGTLLFWEMDKSDIESWILLNYKPSSGNVKEEYRNWIRWYESKNNLTYSQKY